MLLGNVINISLPQQGYQIPVYNTMLQQVYMQELKFIYLIVRSNQ